MQKRFEVKCSLEVVVVEQMHAKLNKFQTISKNIIPTVNVQKTHSPKMSFSTKTFSTVNETCPDMMASCSFPANTKNNELYLVRRRDLVKTKSHHISQLFVCKFQSQMQHAFQSKHSHSTPGISIYFHTPSCCDVARIH